jgi:rubrerythrin
MPDDPRLLALGGPLIPFFRQQPERVDHRSWAEQVRDKMRHHVDIEHSTIVEYGQLADDTSNEAVAYLMRIILDDERRHHTWFRELINSVDAAIELRKRGDEVPSPTASPISEQVVDATRRLLAIERDDHKELKALHRDLHSVERTTLWSVLVSMMLKDTEKHILILESILDLARD